MPLYRLFDCPSEAPVVSLPPPSVSEAADPSGYIFRLHINDETDSCALSACAFPMLVFIIAPDGIRAQPTVRYPAKSLSVNAVHEILIVPVKKKKKHSISSQGIASWTPVCYLLEPLQGNPSHNHNISWHIHCCISQCQRPSQPRYNISHNDRHC